MDQLFIDQGVASSQTIWRSSELWEKKKNKKKNSLHKIYLVWNHPENLQKFEMYVGGNLSSSPFLVPR